MTERFICDCGQIYTERAAVRECQAARHSAAAGNELADAERSARQAGVEPADSYNPDEDHECRDEDLVESRAGRWYCSVCGVSIT